jgi:hypothetical protein
LAAGLAETFIAVCFLALAAWFVFSSGQAEIPTAATPEVDEAALSTAPIRDTESDRPTVNIAGFELNCMECHALFRSRPETPRRLTQHQHIVLDHGINDRCFNCHDNENRNALSLRGDRTVPYTEVARLCAKCHGPTYRDWQGGLHGRSMYAWDPNGAGQRRLRCSECHDPHAPAVDPFTPLPGPNTLRMGEPQPAHHGGEVDIIDPLRHWQGRAEAQHAPSHEGETSP